MSVKLNRRLPAYEALKEENLPLIEEGGAEKRILVLNLMPTKVVTETQLARLFAESGERVEMILLKTASHASKHVSEEHMETFYTTLDEIRNEYFDGIVVTGAPVENIPFEDVDYWEELCEIFNWSESHVKKALFICWGAQAALYHFYGVKKHPVEEKVFGIFTHSVKKSAPVTEGFGDTFLAPHSRHTEVRTEEVEGVSDLDILATSDEAGLYLASSRDGKRLFVTGHPEYDRDTLKKEYFRDVDKGLDIKPPRNYFPNEDTSKDPMFNWHGHARTLYDNWLK